LPLAKLALRELEPGDIVTRFSLGHANLAPLKVFLRKKAKDYHTQNIAKTYVLADEDKAQIYGYVSLVCSQVKLEVNNPVPDFPYDYPCVKIVRLAIDKELKGKGLGKDLISWSISISKERIMPHVGCRFLVVDSKASAIQFYEKCGFTLLDTETNKASAHPLLFLDLLKI